MADNCMKVIMNYCLLCRVFVWLEITSLYVEYLYDSNYWVCMSSICMTVITGFVYTVQYLHDSNNWSVSLYLWIFYDSYFWIVCSVFV